MTAVNAKQHVQRAIVEASVMAESIDTIVQHAIEQTNDPTTASLLEAVAACVARMSAALDRGLNSVHLVRGLTPVAQPSVLGKLAGDEFPEPGLTD